MAYPMSLLCVGFLLIIFCGRSPVESYTRGFLGGRYLLSWEFRDDYIHITASMETDGWVGFGINSVGDLRGAQFVVAGVGPGLTRPTSTTVGPTGTSTSTTVGPTGTSTSTTVGPTGTSTSTTVDPSATPPVDDPSTTTPTEDPSATPPVDDPSTTTPTEDPSATPPVDDPSTTTPTEDPSATPPVDDPSTTTPTEDPSATPPVDYPSTTTPTEDPTASTPTDDTTTKDDPTVLTSFETTTLEAITEPVEDTESTTLEAITEPVEDPESTTLEAITEPVEDPESTTLEAITEPVEDPESTTLEAITEPVEDPESTTLQPIPEEPEDSTVYVDRDDSANSDVEFLSEHSLFRPKYSKLHMRSNIFQDTIPYNEMRLGTSNGWDKYSGSWEFHGASETMQSGKVITTMSWSRKVVPDNTVETRLDLFQDVSVFVNFGENDNPDSFDPAENHHTERINLYQPSITEPSAAQRITIRSLIQIPAIIASLSLYFFF